MLPDVAITRERLQQEWQLAATILQPELLKRLSLCIVEGNRFVGIPRDPDAETQRMLSSVVEMKRLRAGSSPSRGDASFVILKVLLHHWLTEGDPVTTDWLATTCGYSYATVAPILHGLGSLIERQTDRRVRLRWFSRDEFDRLRAMSDRARGSVRFADRSGRPRTLESHIRRLEQLAPADIAIGGILGARHYVPELDLVGAPRLDLSQHSPKRHLDLGFVEALDPALKRVDDPLEPATVVVHAVRHANPLFQQREGGLRWADPVECLLDLFDAGLGTQGSQFLDALKNHRTANREPGDR